jgi:uncharacterized membrane protein YtjA (UPF0391 family)
MLHYSVMFFAITIATSFLGFGGVLPTLDLSVPFAVAVTKALAVVCLILFLGTLYRLLYDES